MESFKKLLRSFSDNDSASFLEAAEKIIGDEREAGHAALADELTGILRDADLSAAPLVQTRDALTNVLNRACMEQRIAAALNVLRADELFALFIIDLDHFKEINDTLGHQQGDKTLADVGAALGRIFRTTDIVGRLGGDEFMAFLPRIPGEALAAKKAAEVVAALQITVGENLGITASVGVIIADNAGGRNFEEIYRAADAALYEAKRRGKNQYRAVHLSSEEGADRPLPVSGTVQLQALLTYMDGAVLLLELSEEPFRVLYVSPSYRTSLGCHMDCCEGARLAERIEPEDREALHDVLHEGARTGQAVTHSFRIRGRSKTLWWNARAVRIPYGGGEGPVLIVVLTDITPLKELEIANACNGERIRTAFEQTSQVLWEVDVAARTFAVFDAERQHVDAEQTYADIPQSLLDAGWAHPDARQGFAAFMEALLAGRDRDSAAFILRYPPTAPYSWARLSYHMLRDAAGRPLKAVGIAQPLPGIEAEQVRFQREERLFELLRGTVQALVTANCTTDAITSLTLNPGRDLPFTSFSDFFAWHLSTLCEEQDVACCREHFSLEALRRAHAAGINWIMRDYRQRDLGGNPRWISVVAHLLINPVTRDLHVFCCARDAAVRRRWEDALALSEQSMERDTETRLYTRETGISIIRRLLASQMLGQMQGQSPGHAPDELPGESPDTASDTASGRLPGAPPPPPRSAPAYCALALVRILGLDGLDAPGARRAVLASIGRLFRIFLDGESVVCLASRGRLLIFWPECPSDLWVRQRMTGILDNVQRLRESGGPHDGVAFVTGIAVARHGQAGYDGLHAQAAYVCELHNDAQADTVVSFDSQLEKQRLVSGVMDGDSMRSVPPDEGERPLSAAEKDVLLHALSGMVAAQDYEASVSGLLRTLGEFYDADRVYTLALSRDMLFIRSEWCAPGRSRLYPHMKPAPLKKMPVIARTFSERRPVLFCARQMVHIHVAPSGTPDKMWRFIAVPFLVGDAPIGALCVENPRVHYTDTALLSQIARLALNERRRHRLDAQRPALGDLGEDGRDALTGLPDQAAYAEALHMLEEGDAASLGILYCSVDNLHSINRQFGIRHGDALLTFAACSLEDIFSRDQCFRPGENLFAVLSRNISGEGFMQRCSRLQSLLHRRRTDRFSLGYAWSDKKEDMVRTLADSAERMMREKKRSDDDAMLSEDEVALGLRDDIGLGRYVVYLQPVMDLQTGTVVGAEALSRYVRSRHGVAGPLTYLPRFERLGVVRELDFHSLELALRLLETWRARGRRDLRCSVNLSRRTMADPAALAAVLAIHSRHDVPAALAGIEVTEGPGGDRQALDRTAACLREEGFPLILDSFGTGLPASPVVSVGPCDGVKIDKSLVDDLPHNAAHRKILEKIIKTCAASNVFCVAKGVESQEVYDILRDLGCPCAQGYYFDKPLPPDVFEKKYLLRTDATLVEERI